jgi:hypothetical protein
MGHYNGRQGPPGRLAAELPHQRLGIRSELVVAAAQMALNKLGLLPAVSIIARGSVGAAAAEAAMSQIADTLEAGNRCRET